MVSVLSGSKPTWTRIRASWRCVQRALFDKNAARSDRHRHVIMVPGEANLLHSGAKAVYQGSGLWVVYGYTADGSDVTSAIQTMNKSWIELNTQPAS